MSHEIERYCPFGNLFQQEIECVYLHGLQCKDSEICPRNGDAWCNGMADRYRFLERMIKKYYLANYDAKKSVGIDPGICGIATMVGNEEHPIISDVENLKKIIEDLPLYDCGV